jgi:hypothetical protein
MPTFVHRAVAFVLADKGLVAHYCPAEKRFTENESTVQKKLSLLRSNNKTHHPLQLGVPKKA